MSALPLGLNTLNLGQPAPRLVHKTIQVNGQPFTFFHPPGDDTILGTLSCLQNDKFHLRDVQFQPGDVMVDIGCNVGLLGLIIAKYYPDTRVFGFDASDLAVEAARAGAAANGLTNYQAFHVAVGDVTKDKVTFYSNGKDKSCLVGEGLNKTNKVEECSARQIAIDEIFDSHLLGIERVKMMKVDVEGAEYKIFDRLFAERKDILDRISYLHLEIHGYEEYDPKGLEAKVKEKWGDKVFFDV